MLPRNRMLRPSLTSSIPLRTSRTVLRYRRYNSTMAGDKPHPKYPNLPLGTSGPLECAITGTALLNTPYFNKGAAFSAEEREAFKLTGLLPQNVQTLDQQVKRAYSQYQSRQDDLAKNTFMTSMKEQNEILYYRVSSYIFVAFQLI